MTVQPIQPQDRRPKKSAERANKRKQAEMDAEAIGIRVDGVEYVLNRNDITGRAEADIRKQVGMSVTEIVDAMGRGGLDYVCMFMWACKFLQGEDVDLDDLLDSVSAASDAEMLTPDEIQASQGPKASGSAS